MEIFATGVFLQPQLLSNGKWAWVAVSFEDDSFMDGQMAYPSSYWQDDKDDLLEKENEDE